MPTATRKQRGVSYSRYSRLGSRDAAHLRTLDAQDETNEGVANRHGITIVASFSDEGKSGGTNEREGLQQALAMIERGDAKVLVAARLSRLARSVPGLREIFDRVEQAGGRVVIGDLGIDTGTASGKLMRDILAAFAEFELELAREHSHDARSKAIAEGRPIMARVPWGYVRESKLVKHPQRAKVVTELFRMRAAGQTWQQLSDHVTAETGEYLTPRTLQKMLANPTYLGSVRSGSLVNGDAHPPLTDPATWQAAQGRSRVVARRKHESLLAGVMTCSGCGKPMTYHLQQRKGREPFGTYRCQRNSAEGRCPAPVTVSAAMADAAVVESFRAWAGRQRGVELTPKLGDQIEDAELLLERAKVELARFLASPIASVVDEDALVAAAAERQQAVDDAEARLIELRGSHQVETLRLSAVDVFDMADVDQRRTLIVSALDSCVVHRSASTRKGVPFSERAVITWLGD